MSDQPGVGGRRWLDEDDAFGTSGDLPGEVQASGEPASGGGPPYFAGKGFRHAAMLSQIPFLLRDIKQYPGGNAETSGRLGPAYAMIEVLSGEVMSLKAQLASLIDSSDKPKSRKAR